jgi:histone acetyltransferase
MMQYKFITPNFPIFNFPSMNLKKEMNNNYTFHTIRNNGERETMKSLIDLKNIFARQLPKMPKEYIVRLIFDSKHESIVIKNKSDVIFGGVTYCHFEEVKLCEVVFLAISSDSQIKGYGTILMNKLKSEMQLKDVSFLMTCADNLAIGYFQKQGFHSKIIMPESLYKGYLKDYEGSTLMECLIDDKIDYFQIGNQIKQLKEKLQREIEKKNELDVVYKGIKTNEKHLDVQSIPGLNKIKDIRAGFDEISKIKAGSSFQTNCWKIVEQLKNHKSIWPFLNAVKKEEVPDYYDIIKSPMHLLKIEENLKLGKYVRKKEFADDLRLIITNCQTYNQRLTIYYKASVELEKYMSELLDSLRDEKEVGANCEHKAI